MLAEHFRTIASYNAWANGQVYDAANALPEAEYRKRRPAGFFGSIHATLNHLLVVDRLWSGRIEGQGPGDITGLDQILYDDLSALRTAREDEDRRIVGLVDALDEAALAGTRDFKDTRGNPHTMPIWQMLATVFNHQTHHRGQAHALFMEAGLTLPPLDLPVYLRATK